MSSHVTFVDNQTKIRSSEMDESVNEGETGQQGRRRTKTPSFLGQMLQDRSFRRLDDSAKAKKKQKQVAADIARSLNESINRCSSNLDESAYENDYIDDLSGEDKEEWQLGDPLYDDYYRFGKLRNQAGAFINSSISLWLITFLISMNSIILGVVTFLDPVDDEKAYHILENIGLTCLCVFTAETTTQFFYLGKKFIKKPWLVFDFFIVLSSWVFEDSEMSALRALRIFRVFALMSRWKSLKHLVEAVGKTVPKMVTIWVTLIIFFYSFAVFYTNLYGHLYDDGILDYDYFGRLDRTFLTLFQFMTLDSWTGVVRQVLDEKPWAWIGFSLWVIITAFFVLNLFTGIICESLIDLNSKREKRNQRRLLKDQRNLITKQTEQLMTETHQVFLLQRQMLENQILMQRALLEIVNKDLTEDEDEIEKKAKKKRQQHMIKCGLADVQITETPKMSRRVSERFAKHGSSLMSKKLMANLATMSNLQAALDQDGDSDSHSN